MRITAPARPMHKDKTGAYAGPVVWGETPDGDIVHVGPATVKLPTKS